MSSLPDVQNRIQQTVGIQVSSEWLQACISYVNQQQNNASSLVDRCLHQLLYTDIRDLVDHSNNAATAITNLQQLIARSKSSPPPIITNGQRSANTIIQTPNDFSMLVQLEEAVDVSLSREQRFNPQHFRAPAENNNRNRNPNHLPRLRCLKLCLSSGHSTNTPLLAQEVTTISNLHPDSPAGMKILLKGSIQIKHGYLQLHSGNATVLGGHVTELVQLQQVALEKARKEMGVGVDPTVRALVGVEDIVEEPSDEGNEQSGDVEMADANSAQHTTTTTSFTAPAAPVATTNASNSFSTTTSGRQGTTGTFSNNGTTNANNNSYSSNRSHQPSAPPAPAPAAAAPIIQAPNNPYRNIGPFGVPRTSNNSQPTNPPPQSSSTNDTTRTNPNNPYARQQRQGTITPRVSISPRNSNAAASTNNPYATKSASNTTRPTSTSSHGSAASFFPTNAETTTTPTSNLSNAITPASTAAAPRNPYLKQSSANNANQGSSAPAAAASNSGFRTASSMLPSGNPSMPPPPRSTSLPLSTTPPSTTNATNKNTTTMNRASNVQNMTFANLYKLLEQAVQNQQLYTNYREITFRVAMLQQTENIVFNVGKNKDYKKNKQKENTGKYEFITNALFGTTGGDKKLLLACKLPSALVESCFSISATELRQLSKTNRQKCDEIAKQGGDQIRAKYFPKYLQYWKARLFPTVEEVFGSAGNGQFALDNVQTPILILEPDKT